MKNGYDRYLEFQYSRSGGFFRYLFRAIGKADTPNREKLALGFPEEVDAYMLFTRQGSEKLLERCTRGHPLIERMRSE